MLCGHVAVIMWTDQRFLLHCDALVLPEDARDLNGIFCFLRRQLASATWLSIRH
jgi:hypothetical protein